MTMEHRKRALCTLRTLQTVFEMQFRLAAER
jgi:hypothetical protein